MGIDDGGAAFPGPMTMSTGMSLRDYFAGQALVGFAAALMATRTPPAPGGADTLAAAAYDAADAMLRARREAR
jgi:hypothetical protein